MQIKHFCLLTVIYIVLIQCDREKTPRSSLKSQAFLHYIWAPEEVYKTAEVMSAFVLLPEPVIDMTWHFLGLRCTHFDK